MKKFIDIKRVLRALMILTVVMIIQSCVAYQQPYSSQQQVPVSDIVQMSKDGLSSRDIISQIRQSRSVYGLKADELAKLRDEGVSDSVINYMEKTHFDYMSQNQRNYPYYGYGWDNGFGYYGGLGWPYYGWGWGFGPTIVLRSYGGFHGGGFHGGFHGHGGRH